MSRVRSLLGLALLTLAVTATGCAIQTGDPSSENADQTPAVEQGTHAPTDPAAPEGSERPSPPLRGHDDNSDPSHQQPNPTPWVHPPSKVLSGPQPGNLLVLPRHAPQGQ